MLYFGLFWNNASISLKITCNCDKETTQSYEQSQHSIPVVSALTVPFQIAASLEKTPETTAKSPEDVKLQSKNKYGDVGYEHVKWKIALWNLSSFSAKYVKGRFK